MRTPSAGLDAAPTVVGNVPAQGSSPEVCFEVRFLACAPVQHAGLQIYREEKGGLKRARACAFQWPVRCGDGPGNRSGFSPAEVCEDDGDVALTG